jgi:hypothetical protein
LRAGIGAVTGFVWDCGCACVWLKDRSAIRLMGSL